MEVGGGEGGISLMLFAIKPGLEADKPALLLLIKVLSASCVHENHQSLEVCKMQIAGPHLGFLFH